MDRGVGRAVIHGIHRWEVLCQRYNEVHSSRATDAIACTHYNPNTIRILLLDVFGVSRLARSTLLDPRLSDTPISLAIGRVGKLSVGRSPRRSLDRG